MFLFFYPAKVDIFSYDMTEYGVSAPTYDGERLRKNSRFFSEKNGFEEWSPPLLRSWLDRVSDDFI